jgi:hypothetical protein
MEIVGLLLWSNGKFFCGEGPHCRCYGPTAALRFMVQPCDVDGGGGGGGGVDDDEDDDY